MILKNRLHVNKITIKPINFVNGIVNVPGSKSISNRVLLLSSLSEGKTKIFNLSNCIDTQIMLYALKNLNVKYNFLKDLNTCIITGNGMLFDIKKSIKIFLGNSGITSRLLISILSLCKIDVTLNSSKEMKNRPIKDLVNSIRLSGANIKYIERNYYLPIKIYGGFKGGRIIVNGDVSSQFLSSLIIAAPLANSDTIITVKNNLVSKTYVDMTIKIMEDFGVKIQNENFEIFKISGNQKYISPKTYYVEGDFSSASYFLAASAIKGGKIEISNVKKNSIQGDIKFCSILEKMGSKILWKENSVLCEKKCLRGITVDMTNIPDTAMTLVILALYSEGETIINGISHWRYKESNRILSMGNSLKRIGANFEIGENFIKIYPGCKFKNSVIKTYNDHRIAMCFSLIALSGVQITILNPECVDKTFPNYFCELEKISYR
ncbi:3-phosphoshikimate 1-carboxyvinyltransferase [Candidatus Riesia sp. GBBU]|nr:3-phosphoshikimate 1-carboxyvinyltransferase [Candidatus Riesia sp. GBBU]